MLLPFFYTEINPPETVYHRVIFPRRKKGVSPHRQAIYRSFSKPTCYPAVTPFCHPSAVFIPPPSGYLAFIGATSILGAVSCFIALASRYFIIRYPTPVEVRASPTPATTASESSFALAISIGETWNFFPTSKRLSPAVG